MNSDLNNTLIRQGYLVLSPLATLVLGVFFGDVHAKRLHLLIQRAAAHTE